MRTLVAFACLCIIGSTALYAASTFLRFQENEPPAIEGRCSSMWQAWEAGEQIDTAGMSEPEIRLLLAQSEECLERLKRGR